MDAVVPLIHGLGYMVWDSGHKTYGSGSKGFIQFRFYLRLEL